MSAHRPVEHVDRRKGYVDNHVGRFARCAGGDAVGIEVATPWCANVIRAARVQRRERVIVAVDEPLRPEAERLASALEDAEACAQLVLLPPDALEEAPAELIETAAQCDVWIAMWKRPRRLTAAQNRLIQTLQAGGARRLGMPLVTRELLNDELSRPSPDLEPSARRLLDALGEPSELRIRGYAGTDLTISVEGQRWQSDALPLQPGGVANYPGGEVFILPRNANGRLVADITVPYVSNTLLNRPVEIHFAHGRIVSIEGDATADRLRELVTQAEGHADQIAELGIGVNPTLSPRGHVLIDEKIAGSAHVAIGSNIHMGGGQAASIHVDCVFWAAELRVDGAPIEVPARSCT
jgi:hypothetical protein